jgi:hypothetical protein
MQAITRKVSVRTLKLTSPLMRGDDVRQLQTELKKDHYLQGEVDGVYGPDTARAVHRAKYWLGYRVPDKTASTLLMTYLKGAPLTPAMAVRKERRKRLKAEQPIRLRMMAEARKWKGTKESPAGSNRVLFSNWYGLTGPWCAMFTTYCGVKVGSNTFIKGKRWAYVPFMVNDARAGRNGLAVTFGPLVGDLVTYDWQGDGIADHVGFFDGWLDTARTQFKALEGNTGIGNDSNGGQVMERDRNRRNVVCFIHVGR